MNGIAAYKEHVVVTQAPGRVVVLLYEGAVKFLRQAIIELRNGNMVEKGRLINKAIEIIIELSVSLDTDAGGEVAQNLRALYAFMGEHLTRDNFQKDPEAIEEVISLLDELNEGWKAIAG